jgi:hypothetical protein
MTHSSQASIDALPRGDKSLLFLQLIATLAILAFVPGNGWKLAAFIATWIVTTRRISTKELVCYIGVCVLFSAMDIMAVHQRVFFFSHPDIAGLPIWEFFMWGFFVLHTLRMLNGPPSPTAPLRALPFAILMALPFMTIADQLWLMIAASGALAVGLVFFHEQDDLKYVGYMMLIGALFEYTGVWSNQWSYPGNPIGGVPFWFVAMWGGVGLYARRLLSPLLVAGDNTSSQLL